MDVTAIAREIAWILVGIVLLDILFKMLRSSWLFWRQSRYKASIKWVFLEFRIPREILRGPRAMEQLLVVLRSLRSGPDTFEETYLDGQVYDWFSLEMASIGGQVHFYVRAPIKMRNIIEATVFSYYPEIEVHEVDDYMSNFPSNMEELESQGYNLWGTELDLTKNPAYPIRTYANLEIKSEGKEQSQDVAGFDPMSPFLEMFAKMKPDEMYGIQILLLPKPNDWNKEYEKVLAELQASKKKKSSGPGVKTEMQFSGGILPIFVTKEIEKKDEPAPPKSPGETEAIKAVEANLSKPAFDVLVRILYLSPKSIFHVGLPFAGFRGAFSQFNTLNMNAFKYNGKMTTMKVAGKALWLRKGRMLYNYRKREIPPETGAGYFYTSFFSNKNYLKWLVLNVEAVASIFHPPTNKVLTGPHVERLESKKVGPPAGLAIFAGDEEILPFQ